MRILKIWLKIDNFGELALRHVNLLIQKMTADDQNTGRLCPEEVRLQIYNQLNLKVNAYQFCYTT